MNPKISIIVPVYKAEQYICECIDSILAQAIEDFELILIDDGSPDKSGEICDEYANKDSRIKVIHKENRGPSSARNTGIEISKGEYIGFVDSDDTIDRMMYYKMYNLALKENCDIVACGYDEVNSFTEVTQKWVSPLNNKLMVQGKEIKEEFELFLSKNKIFGYASMCNKLYRRNYIIDRQIYINEKIKIAEDLCFNIEAILNAQKVCAINEDLYKYRRINSDSIMNKKDNTFYLHLEARKEILHTLRKNNVTSLIYNRCARYENCKTIAEYIERIKDIIGSQKGINMKYDDIYKSVHEQYFLSSLYDFDREYLVLKAKVIVVFLKIALYLEKVFKIRIKGGRGIES